MNVVTALAVDFGEMSDCVVLRSVQGSRYYRILLQEVYYSLKIYEPVHSGSFIISAATHFVFIWCC